MLRKKRNWLYIGVMTAVLMGFSGFFYLSPYAILERIASIVVYPILVIRARVGGMVQRVTSYIHDQRSLRDELCIMKECYQQLLADHIVLQSSIDMTSRLQEIIDMHSRYAGSSTFLAQVIDRDFSEAGHFFLMDAGSRHGIEQDMVAVYKNCLIGRVVATFPFYSKVQLITDKHCKVASYCVESGATGIYEGNHTLEEGALAYVSHLAEVKAGDLVFSNGEGLIFPRGFALGKVAVCQREGLYYSIKVKPLISMRDIEFCSLLKKGNYSAL